MADRRRTKRTSDRRHPLREHARLKPAGPAIERRKTPRAATRERLTVQLPVDVIERLRNAVYYTDGLTINGFIERCITTIVDAMEASQGKAFPKRKAPLRPGRPPKG